MDGEKEENVRSEVSHSKQETSQTSFYSDPHVTYENKQRMSVLDYILSELTRGYMLERDEAKYREKRQRVYTFMKTPRELEKFLVYGFFQCVDAFLFIFTFLPLRIALAFLRILTQPCGMFFSRSPYILEPAQRCDILKGVILVVCCFIVNHIDTSMMYHLVRGQAVIKLYVFFNMLEVADRLFSSFGHDILDSLFWTATEPRDKKREHFGVLPHLLLAIIYVILHTLLILFQATVLSVAFNSHNKSLLTIMMSNNFVEIKGNLFKRVDKNNLFQISCSDVKERFHYVMLLSVVFISNMTEFSWNPDHVWVIIPDAVLVLMAELVVDWIKHAFITKFNKISADVYQVYTLNLAQDVATSRQSHAFTDHSDMVSRRMDFTPLPLACLLIRVCSKSVKITGYVGIVVLVVLYLCLITFKILNSILLLARAYSLLSKAKKEREHETPESTSSVATEKSSSSVSVNNTYMFESSSASSSQPNVTSATSPSFSVLTSAKSPSSVIRKRVRHRNSSSDSPESVSKTRCCDKTVAAETLSQQNFVLQHQIISKFENNERENIISDNFLSSQFDSKENIQTETISHPSNAVLEGEESLVFNNIEPIPGENGDNLFCELHDMKEEGNSLDNMEKQSDQNIVFAIGHLHDKD